MENLIFSLNVTIPVFLMMVIGFLLNKTNTMDREFADKINTFVFKIALPVLVFEDLSKSDFSTAWDTRFVLFCFFATLISIVISILISYMLKDKAIQGEFSQASFRSSCALLGCALVQNIYGSPKAASLMIIGAVPLYNIAAVVILTLQKPDSGKMDKEMIYKTLKGIITNPIILGIVVGFIWSLLKIPQPPIFEKTVSSVAAIATPLGLMALGATFDVKKAFGMIKPTIVCTVFKLVVFVAIFIPIAIKMGFRDDKLVASLVMLGAATTVSSFTMATSMGHEGTLSSNTVMATTLMSAFTLTFWIYITKIYGLI